LFFQTNNCTLTPDIEQGEISSDSDVRNAGKSSSQSPACKTLGGIVHQVKNQSGVLNCPKFSAAWQAVLFVKSQGESVQERYV
jgi:hypothetical protein